MNADLFNDLPFNLAGESLNDEFDARQAAEEKRVRELAKAEADKAQGDLYRDLGHEERGCKCAFDGWEAEEIDCPKCLSASAFHELSGMVSHFSKVTATQTDLEVSYHFKHTEDPTYAI